MDYYYLQKKIYYYYNSLGMNFLPPVSTVPNYFTYFVIGIVIIALLKDLVGIFSYDEDFETDLFDDESRTRAKDTEALKRLLLDHFVPLGNHLRNQKSIDGNSIDLTESTLNFKSLDSLVKHATELVNLGGQKVM